MQRYVIKLIFLDEDGNESPTGELNGATVFPIESNPPGALYLCSDADARIAELDQELSQAASAVEAKGMEIVGLQKRVAELERGLRDLSRAYVSLMESGRERIIFLGGDAIPSM